MAIPLGTMLKRATTADSTIEEDTLNSRLLAVQMWMIYWIVNGCVHVLESVLLLTYLPLYSVARLLFSVWLVAPIMLNLARLLKKLLVTHNEIQAEWVTFSQQGCGMVYFQYVKPLMEGRLLFLYDLKPDEILARLSSNLAVPIFKVLAMHLRNTGTAENSGSDSSSGSGSGEVPTAGNYMQTFATLSSFSKIYFPSREVKETPEETSRAEDLDEYDVVDTPLNALVTGLKNRSVAEKPETRRWFW